VKSAPYKYLTNAIPNGIIYTGDRNMDNRAVLMRKSISLFADRGYEAVGVQEICEESGVTKPTLYHYFGSKRGLLDAIVKEYGDIMIRDISAASDYDRNLPATLEKMAFAFYRFAEGNLTFYRMKLSMYFAPKDSEPNMAFKELDLSIFSILEDVLRKAVPIYGNIRGREKITAALIIGAFNTFIGLRLNGFIELTDDIIRQSLRTVQFGIYN